MDCFSPPTVKCTTSNEGQTTYKPECQDMVWICKSQYWTPFGYGNVVNGMINIQLSTCFSTIIQPGSQNRGIPKSFWIILSGNQESSHWSMLQASSKRSILRSGYEGVSMYTYTCVLLKHIFLGCRFCSVLANPG